MIHFRRIRPFLVFSALFLALPQAWAAGANTYSYLGLEAGVGLLNAGAGSHFDWGVNLGTHLLPNIIVGGYYSYIPYGSVSSPNGVSVSGSEKFYGAEGRWDFTPFVNGFAAGVRAGLSSVSTQAVVPGQGQDNESSNGFAWGPIFTYERPISNYFSFGGQAYFMIPSETAANNVFGLLATFRYLF